MPIYSFTLEPILISIAANDTIGPKVTKITTDATIIATDALKSMGLQMDFIVVDFQKDFPACYAMVVKSYHRTTGNCFLTPISFCLDRSSEL